MFRKDLSFQTASYQSFSKRSDAPNTRRTGISTTERTGISTTERTDVSTTINSCRFLKESSIEFFKNSSGFSEKQYYKPYQYLSWIGLNSYHQFPYLKLAGELIEQINANFYTMTNTFGLPDYNNFNTNLIILLNNVYNSRNPTFICQDMCMKMLLNDLGLGDYNLFDEETDRYIEYSYYVSLQKYLNDKRREAIATAKDKEDEKKIIEEFNKNINEISKSFIPRTNEEYVNEYMSKLWKNKFICYFYNLVIKLRENFINKMKKTSKLSNGLVLNSGIILLITMYNVILKKGYEYMMSLSNDECIYPRLLHILKGEYTINLSEKDKEKKLLKTIYEEELNDVKKWLNKPVTRKDKKKHRELNEIVKRLLNCNWGITFDDELLLNTIIYEVNKLFKKSFHDDDKLMFELNLLIETVEDENEYAVRKAINFDKIQKHKELMEDVAKEYAYAKKQKYDLTPKFNHDEISDDMATLDEDIGYDDNDDEELNPNPSEEISDDIATLDKELNPNPNPSKEISDDK